MGKTVVITGATRGIGREAALALAARGHRVIAIGRDETALASLRTLGIEARRLDLANDDLERFALDVGPVDVLVNNAGAQLTGPIMDLSSEQLREQFEVNVFAPMALCRAFGRGMAERGTGRIVNVSSVSGRMPAPFIGAYHASKYAIEALSDALRMELAPFGIAVVLIEPGTIKTEFASRGVADAQSARPANTLYGKIYDAAPKILGRAASQAVRPERLIPVFIEAVESERPAPRYVVPRRHLATIWALHNLPTRWTDALMSSAFGLTARNLKR